MSDSADIAIKAGGTSRAFSGVRKLNTHKTAGGTQKWIPEDGLTTLSVQENGTYAAGDEGHLAYTRVSVNVRPDLEALSVTENGTYVPGTNIDGFSQVTVNVAGGGGSGGTGGDSGDGEGSGESAGGNTYVVGGNRYVIGQDTNWHYWIGTLDEYMAISTPNPRTVYFILPPDDDMPANETTDEDLDERE